jgi:hypothetical protein
VPFVLALIENKDEDIVSVKIWPSLAVVLANFGGKRGTIRADAIASLSDDG